MAVKLSGRYASVDEVAEKLNVTPIYIRALLGQQRIVGAVRIGHAWLIPLPVKVLEHPSGNARRPSRIKMVEGA